MRRYLRVAQLAGLILLLMLALSIAPGNVQADPATPAGDAAEPGGQDASTQGHVVGDDLSDTPLELHHDHDHQHGGSGGHLPGSALNVELVGRLQVSGAAPGHIADVASHRNHAYLAARRLTTPCGIGGFYTVDISDPANPQEVSFTAFPPDSYPGEGMQVVSLNTPHFRGDVLVANNENCGTNPARVGGVSLYDVSDPTNIQPLAIGAGDTGGGTLPRAHQSHSAFAWQAGQRAFAIIVDNEEADDVDIMEITDPRNPLLIAEVNLLHWPDAHTPLARGNSVFLHDMVVKRVRGNYLALLSYWDAGWIVLNVNDPANPVFVNDSDHPDPDPLLGSSPPEGNAHQAEWSHNNKFIVGTDEDFGPRRTEFQITTGPHAGSYGAGEFSWTVPLADQFPAGLSGPTIWGGSGCVEDTNGNGISDRDEVPPAASLPANPGEAKIVVLTRGTCFFSIKVESGQLAGYDAVIIANSHGGSRSGFVPDSFVCGAQGHAFTITVSALCLGHRGMHLLFNDSPEYSGADSADMPPIGTLGERISASTQFDAWGGIHLLDGQTLQTLDQYRVPETEDPAFASGFGSLTVHEVAMDKAQNLGYLSWYDAGLRVIRFGPEGIQEVGHYVDANGNDFWGVEAHRLPGDPTETTWILASDRDSGLWIFRYTGP